MILHLLGPIGTCSVRVDGTSTCVTLPDGSEVHGEPHDTDEYRQTARRLGYGDDVGQLNVEHESCHAVLSHWLGLSESPVMRAVADGAEFGELHALEEAAVMAVQAYANAAGICLLRRWGELCR